eukprot:TRINITY_DN1069_c0_g1_i1.p1 TRINITY_DN1069_c0_g1~~TRINITY_DN1069_c0_g1_i1.p1  ORF type:complete len:91 (-),score=13.96 TRINITY_DN1069_c0_g1_i1:226-498(-)
MKIGEMSQTREWLISINLGNYADQFKAENYVKLADIKEMDDEWVREMIKDVGIKGRDKSILWKSKKLKIMQHGDLIEYNTMDGWQRGRIF